MFRNIVKETVNYFQKSNFRHLALISILFWLMAILTKTFQNGLSFGLDYGAFQPDGAHYYFRTLSFLSASDLSAAQSVADWYEQHGVKLNAIDPNTLLPEYNTVWYLSAPRILYPIASIPFVIIFGAYGMLVVPSLSLLGILLTVNWMSLKYQMPVIGIIINFALVASITIGRWFFSNITDGLLAFLVGFYALLTIYREQLSQRIYLCIMVLLVTLSSATRFSFPIWLFLGFALLLHKKYRETIILWTSSFIGLVPLIFLGIGPAILPSENGSSWVSKASHIPVQSAKVLFIEVAQLLILDKSLLLLIIIGTYCAWKERRSLPGLQVIAVIFGVLVIGFINGTIGVNFRYQLPVLAFLALAIFERNKNHSWLGFKQLSPIDKRSIE